MIRKRFEIENLHVALYHIFYVNGSQTTFRRKGLQHRFQSRLNLC